MADLQNIETRFYVGRINKRNEVVEVVSFDEWNGLFGVNSVPNPQFAFSKQAHANRVIALLNNVYDDNGVTDFRCYLLRNIENMTHVVGEIDEEFQSIFDNFFNNEGEPEVTPEETPEEPTE